MLNVEAHIELGAERVIYGRLNGETAGAANRLREVSVINLAILIDEVAIGDF